jgi:hypothetical protein
LPGGSRGLGDVYKRQMQWSQTPFSSKTIFESEMSIIQLLHIVCFILYIFE